MRGGGGGVIWKELSKTDQQQKEYRSIRANSKISQPHVQ